MTKTDQQLRERWRDLNALLPFIFMSFLYLQDGLTIMGMVASIVISLITHFFTYKRAGTLFLTFLLTLNVLPYTFETVKLGKELLLEEEPHGIIQMILIGWWMVLSFKMLKINFKIQKRMSDRCENIECPL